ncbi:thiolase family protein [Rhodococcus sp. IEGM 1381]|uniref:thiolase family protein n=1 Tax=Rhodococcus sp. IEGM 1381 TaxID=3047085 RepID=UPI0024B6CC29|nr:thiolase family protein [Rhodococcus sp. IEGM 1381]MDI9894438.1 thiolase family protein [Rhodococcus sp. IEGM 1381]
MSESVVIVDVLRTASGKGKPGGALSGVHPVQLLSETLKQLVERNGLDPVLVDDVIAGCVGQSGDQANNPARTAALAAGFPVSVPGTTIDRQCGSSQQAVQFAAAGIRSGDYDIVIACGVESMSRVPMGSGRQNGSPMAPLASRFPDGLVNQGVGAELIAGRHGFTRAQLDEFSARSHRLAAASRDLARSEIIDIKVTGEDGAIRIHDSDETVRSQTTAEGLAGLKPSYMKEEVATRFPEIAWSITPGNSSPLTDGASAALIMSETKAAELGLRARARVVAGTVVGSDPLTMLDGVVPATRKLLDRTGMSIDDFDTYEVNEAFAPVPLLWLKELGGDLDKLNPRGGAIALGHALGASGVRLLCTMVHHLEHSGGRFGLQTMCEGGGMANATVIEAL